MGEFKIFDIFERNKFVTKREPIIRVECEAMGD